MSVVPEDDVLSGAALWRVNLATNAVTPFVAERIAFGYNLLAHVRTLPDGSLRAFVAQARELPRLGSPVALAYTPNTVPLDGSTLRGRDFEVYAVEELAAWAPDGSGFLLRGLFGDPIGRVKTVWVPVDGGAPFEITNPGERVSWGS